MQDPTVAQRAVPLQHRPTALDMQRTITAAALDWLHDAVVVVDSQLRIAFANRAAEELMAEADAIHRANEAIAARTAEETTLLRSLITGGHGCSSSHGPVGRCSLSRSQRGTPLEVQVVPLRAETAWASALFITDPERDERSCIEALQQRFGLTRAETALLVEIAKADGLQASADRLGVSLATARTHLAHVFDKTGTRRQAELVRLATAKLPMLHDIGDDGSRVDQAMKYFTPHLAPDLLDRPHVVLSETASVSRPTRCGIGTPMPRTPSLDALRIFAVSARHLSFTEAANELHLTQSAVSHRIRGLEEELGFDLFKRLTRRLELTAQGRTLARKVDAAIGDIDRSIVELSQPDDGGPLKVTMLPSVASHWLIPRLPRIRRENPLVDVEVHADPRLLDLRAEGIDLAIRFCRTPNPSYAATRLMSDRVLPVCTPELLRQHGPVEGIDALLTMPLLHDKATDRDGSDSDWRAWLDHHGRQDTTCRAGQQFSEASMLINAALQGLGVALARASLVADHLASGALVSPLKLAAPTAYTYYLLGLPEAVDRPKIAAFRRLLIAEAAMTEASAASINQPVLRPIGAVAAAA